MQDGPKYTTPNRPVTSSQLPTLKTGPQPLTTHNALHIFSERWQKVPAKIVLALCGVEIRLKSG